MFRYHLHQHEPYKSFRLNLPDCEVLFHLIYLIFNCQVCATLVSFHLALHISAKSIFGCFQGLIVNDELSCAFSIDRFVLLFLLRVVIRVGVGRSLTRLCSAELPSRAVRIFPVRQLRRG